MTVSLINNGLRTPKEWVSEPVTCQNCDCTFTVSIDNIYLTCEKGNSKCFDVIGLRRIVYPSYYAICPNTVCNQCVKIDKDPPKMVSNEIKRMYRDGEKTVFILVRRYGRGKDEITHIKSVQIHKFQKNNYLLDQIMLYIPIGSLTTARLVGQIYDPKNKDEDGKFVSFPESYYGNVIPESKFKRVLTNF